MSISRRRFLGASSAAVIAGAMGNTKVFGANDTVGAAIIGINGRGGSHMRAALADEGVQVVALCDTDTRVLDMRLKEIGDKQPGVVPKLYTDVRQVMEDPDVDVILTATPNHWHALITVWGCMAGKHVYVEKPMAHSPWEGRQCVNAAAKYNKVVQHGTQSRSDSALIRDVQLMRDGFIGKIVHSRGYVYKNGNRNAIGHGKPGPVPDYLNWELWQGPAKDVPFQVNVDRPGKPGLHVHYDWHWFWEYGNGEIGNQGVHQMDVAYWFHGRSMPVKISSAGGRYAWDDDAESPNTQATQFTYDDGSLLTFEVRNLGSFPEGGQAAGNCGNSCFGETGYYVRGMGFFDYQNKPMKVEVEAPESIDCFTRFFNAVRTGKQSDAPMTVEDSHFSCLHCQLGNIAYRVGQTVDFDTKTETFLNSEEGNKLIKRDYRKGFEVPDLA
jgi:predicted dehydrogenase